MIWPCPEHSSLRAGWDDVKCARGSKRCEASERWCDGRGHGVHERRIVGAGGCGGGESGAWDEAREVHGAEIGGEMGGGGGKGVGSGSGSGSEEAGERCMSREFRARGPFARAGAGSGSGIAVYRDGMRRCGVSEYVATAGISDYGARGGADGAHCDVPLGDARLVVVGVNWSMDWRCR